MASSQVPKTPPNALKWSTCCTITSLLASASGIHFCRTSLLLIVSLELIFNFSSSQHTEERVTQRNLLNAPHIRIIDKIRINIEENGHIDGFPSIQSLLLKTKTLNFAEIWRHLSRCHTIRCHPNYVFVGLVCSSIKCQCRFPRQDPDLALLWCEFPRQDVGDRAIEGNTDAFRIRDRLQA